MNIAKILAFIMVCICAIGVSHETNQAMKKHLSSYDQKIKEKQQELKKVPVETLKIYFKSLTEGKYALGIKIVPKFPNPEDIKIEKNVVTIYILENKISNVFSYRAGVIADNNFNNIVLANILYPEYDTIFSVRENPYKIYDNENFSFIFFIAMKHVLMLRPDLYLDEDMKRAICEAHDINLALFSAEYLEKRITEHNHTNKTAAVESMKNYLKLGYSVKKEDYSEPVFVDKAFNFKIMVRDHQNNADITGSLMKVGLDQFMFSQKLILDAQINAQKKIIEAKISTIKQNKKFNDWFYQTVIWIGLSMCIGILCYMGLKKYAPIIASSIFRNFYQKPLGYITSIIKNRKAQKEKAQELEQILLEGKKVFQETCSKVKALYGKSLPKRAKNLIKISQSPNFNIKKVTDKDLVYLESLILEKENLASDKESKVRELENNMQAFLNSVQTEKKYQKDHIQIQVPSLQSLINNYSNKKIDFKNAKKQFHAVKRSIEKALA